MTVQSGGIDKNFVENPTKAEYGVLLSLNSLVQGAKSLLRPEQQRHLSARLVSVVLILA